MGSLAEVVLYTTKYCAYCLQAKRLLGQKGVSYREIAADAEPEIRTWLREVSGQSTVPQIFINGRSIGGYAELSMLSKSGRLDDMLATAPPEGAPSVDNGALRSAGED